MVFTSTRSGDLELYTCDIDGSNIQQVTNELGYDGGAFFSPDGQYLVWRASRPAEGEEADAYLKLLSEGLVQPTAMELWIAKADGSDMRQITDLGGANWAPYFHPDGEHILFSSNHKTKAFPFNIFMTDILGSEPVQITFDNAFDSFPMFSHDGQRLAFSSNRNNGRTRSTNVFVADWIESGWPPMPSSSRTACSASSPPKPAIPACPNWVTFPKTLPRWPPRPDSEGCSC